MRASISLGRWFGVPVGLHYSWFLIASLIALSLTGVFGSLNRSWSPATVWGLSLVTALLFFICIVLHELAHATVARFHGVPVRGITLFALGGIAHLDREASTAGNEFSTAIAGPIASLVIGLGCRAVAIAAGFDQRSAAASAFAAVFAWLAYINLGLALFNLVPAFPLDGGRVLRSIIWKLTNSADRATRIAARVGQIIAIAFIAGGLYSGLVQSNFGGLWIAFIGWFLLEGAHAYYAQTQLATSLQDVRVGDVMARDCGAVDAGTPLEHFVADLLLRTSRPCFAVTRNGRVVGLISAEDAKRVDRREWDRTTVGEAMRPLDLRHAIAPTAPAGEALTLMGREQINQLPVVSDGRFEGVVTRRYLVHLLQMRRALRA